MNTKLLQNIVYLVVGVALVLVIGLGFAKWASAPTQPVPQTPQTGVVSFTIEGVYQNRPVPISSDETVLQVLEGLNTQDKALLLATKDYAGMGTLVEGIHGVTNGTDKKYWQYKVNGIMPQVGAGELKLKNGDSVEWFFSASQE